MTIKGRLKQYYNPSHVTTTRIFAIKLTFVMTIYKSQGSILNFLILSLSERPIYE